MKSLAVACLLGAVSSKNIEPDIWNESIETLSVCGDSKTRWNDASNSVDTYANALKGKSLYKDQSFTASMEQLYTNEAYPQYDRASQYE